MQEGAFFQKALADFTHEAASGGAIRHLADLGYTVEEIRRELTFPTPYAKVQSTVWKHLLDTGVILEEEPCGSPVRERAVYVKEYDQYGRPSFRRATERERPSASGRAGVMTDWKNLGFPREEGKLPGLLSAKIAENGAERSYASCDFGWILAKEPGRFDGMLQVLENRSREYVEGLPWERGRVYHRLDPRMKDIILRLQEAGMYQGTCYFLKTGERLEITLEEGLVL